MKISNLKMPCLVETKVVRPLTAGPQRPRKTFLHFAPIECNLCMFSVQVLLCFAHHYHLEQSENNQITHSGTSRNDKENSSGFFITLSFERLRIVIRESKEPITSSLREWQKLQQTTSRECITIGNSDEGLKSYARNR